MMTTPSNHDASLSRVQVVVRSRPTFQSSSENSIISERVVDINEPESQVIVALEKTFAFDACFDGDSSQKAVYDRTVGPVVQKLLKDKLGHCATILAYGQTCAGKTHTMMGTSSGDERGMIPRALEDIFEVSNPSTDSIGVSFYEILNEKVYDLLAAGRIKVPLAIREEAGSFLVPGLTCKWALSVQEALSLLAQGINTRAMGCTATNENSSRSHAILRISLVQSGRTCSKLSLVDLAGSESVRKSNAEGERLAEANNINRGLLALGNCISDICSKKAHVPFRNSTLTKVLRECLRGDGFTTMIACVSPTEADMAETLNTLRYADRAKRLRKPPVPQHLLAEAMASAKRKRLASLIPPTPAAKFRKTLNNTIATPTPNVNNKTPLRLNRTVTPTLPPLDFSRLTSTEAKSLGAINEEEEEVRSQCSMSDISSIHGPVQTSSSVPDHNATSLLDASVLSPMFRKFATQLEERFMQRFEDTLRKTLKDERKPKKSSPLPRRSARLSNSNKIDWSDSSAEETILSGPAFTAVRQRIRETQKAEKKEGDEVDDGFISSKPLSDVTNQRKASHMQKVAGSASPNLSDPKTPSRRLSNCDKENPATPISTIKAMAEPKTPSMEKMAEALGINPDSPFMFEMCAPTVPRQPKRSVRRTTMLAPELNRTLSEAGIMNTTSSNRRRSVRLATKIEPNTEFKHPLQVKANWKVFDQEQHNNNILGLLNTANLAMLQKVPAIGPKTAFLLHTHRELHGGFESLDDLKAIPGLQKSFFGKFLKTHQIVLN